MYSDFAHYRQMARRPLPGQLRVILAIAMALFLVGSLFSSPAFARHGGTTATKPYSAAAAPASLGAGDSVAATFTITNGAANQDIGSLNITPPAGLTVSNPSSDKGSATLIGGVITVRNMSLDPGYSATVSFILSASCGSTGGAWSSAVKQSNDFNGPPGNNFTLTGGNPVTTVSGACTLAFTTQPANATISTLIRSVAFDPASPAVAVAAQSGDGSPVDGVAVSLASTPDVTLAGGSGTSGPAGAPATFGALGITVSGTYTLTASAPGFASATSAPFTITDTATLCEAGAPCEANAGDKNGSTTINSQGGSDDAGYISISLTDAGAAACGSYTAHSSLSTVDVTTGEPSTATLTIIKALSGKVGVSSFQICFASVLPFADRAGNTRNVKRQAQQTARPQVFPAAPW